MRGRHTLIIPALCLALATPSYSRTDDKERKDDRLGNSARVLQEVLDREHLPSAVLEASVCVLVFPSVKRVAVGFGGSYGRGAMVCRLGDKMDGAWGAPIMYKLDQGSVGAQLGGSATDVVMTVYDRSTADQILRGKTKIGTTAAAAAGPTGAQASEFSPQARILTYTRSRGLFAGASLDGLALEPDTPANRVVYGNDVIPHDVLHGTVPMVTAAEPLVTLLNRTSPKRTMW